MAGDNMTQLFDLPHHLIFGKILLSTKAAVQLSFLLSKQYWNEDVVWSSVPILNFDEDDDFARYNVDYSRRHKKHKRFVKFLKGYLEYYRDKCHLLLLDKLRINMKMYSNEDATIIDQWLKLAFEKGVKELDISGPKIEESGARPPSDNSTWYLNWTTTFANAKSLTSLKLESVKLSSFAAWAESGDMAPLLLPSLKSMSLKALQFDDDDYALYNLLLSCPSIEYLSLIDFQFQMFTLRLPTRTLKSLEFIHCKEPEIIWNCEGQPDILESFTWVGVPINQQPHMTFTWETLLHMAGKSLTSLNLQCVDIVDVRSEQNQNHDRLFPSLKTVSFTTIPKLNGEDLLYVLSECPSLEYLSLTECCFEGSNCHISSSSLKSLEVKHCSQFPLLQVDKTKNLESVTLLPNSNSECRKVIIDDCFNLKSINICDDLAELSLNRCENVSRSKLFK